jgi:predicted aspartyl protease
VYRNSSINDTIIFDTTTYATANLSQRVAINDIDGDGKPDLLVTSNNSNIISVFRNTTTTPGYITFAPKIDLTTGPGPRDLAVADIDGDGKPDLISLAAGVGYGISIWRNLSTPGAISFAARVHISTVVGLTAVKVGDLNNDGKLDIVVASFHGGNISFFRNTSTVGNFSFDTRQDITTGGRPQRLSIGDVNGDSRPDVAVCFDTARAIYIYPGIPGDSIKLGNRVEFKAGVLAGDIAIGDVDGDGEADLAFCHNIGQSGNPVTVLRNKQNGESPIINSFTPTSAGKDTFVTINGKYLSTTSAAKFGAAWADSIQVVSDSVVKARVNNGATGTVQVLSPYCWASKPGFTFIRDTTNIPDTTCPVITSFWPTSGQQGTAVYILGSNFTGSTGVRFGGVPADSIVVISDTMIKAIVDTGATGIVQVLSPYCWASKPGFTFIRDTTNIPDTTCPVITSFWPTSGQQGTAVYILGSNFSGSTGVRFGGVPADSIVIMSDTMIKAIVDTGATGIVQVLSPYCWASKPGFTYISDTTINDTLFVNARTAGANGVIQKSFKLYPNPASKYVTWQQPVTNHKTRLQLVDMTGRIVRQMEVGSNTPQTTIQLQGLMAGVYKLVYIDGKNKITSTLLIK